MTNLELVLNMLAETSAAELSKKEQPKTFSENKKVARKDLEKKLGNRVISPLNAKELGKRLEEDIDKTKE